MGLRAAQRIEIGRAENVQRGGVGGTDEGLHDLHVRGGEQPLASPVDHARTQAEIKRFVWSQPSIRHSFYKNADGEVHGLSPWRLVDYWSWTREPDLDDFVVA